MPRLASHHHGPKAHPPLSNHQVSKSHTVVLCKYEKIRGAPFVVSLRETLSESFRKPLGTLFKNASSLEELSKWNPQFSVRKHEIYRCLFGCYKTKGISVIQ